MFTKQPVLPSKNNLSTALKAGLLIALVIPFTATAAETTLISVTSKGKQGNGRSWHPAISADNRYIVFSSEASNLVSNDTNGSPDIFVHDRLTKKTRRVNVTSDGKQSEPTWQSHSTISSNGRYVAYTSQANNLVPGDNNKAYDVFVYDLKTKKTSLISVSSDGEQHAGDGAYSHWGGLPSLSGDGRYVAFWSNASNLVDGDTNGIGDIFVHDRNTKTTTRVNVSSKGVQANRDSKYLKLSDNGRYVAFHSAANNLVKGDTNDREDIFVHDRETKETTRVSVATDGTQGNNSSWSPVISADGRYVAFWSAASTLVANDTNFTEDVFVHDRVTHETKRVSVASDGSQGDKSSTRPSISADGRYIGFSSDATNFATNDDNGDADVFVHDQITGTTKLVSVTLDGTSGTGPGGLAGVNNTNGSRDAIISPDGKYMAFRSLVTDLVANDTNGEIDVFLRDLTQ